jgi:7 transmembrane receptor (rhodopsin family)
VLVCAAVKRERKLRSMFNYFLVSLALSDMMSATLVMPLSIVRAFIGNNGEFLTNLARVRVSVVVRSFRATSGGLFRIRCTASPYIQGVRVVGGV